MDTLDYNLEPLSYHFALRDYLKSNERELWEWFASARAQVDYTENLRLELLKSTYRLDPEAHPGLYEGVKEARNRLGLDIPVTLYQAQNAPQLNAALYFTPGEGHVVFSGPVLTLLNAEEVKSVIGHELAHYHLWQRDQCEFHITDRLLQAVASDPRAAASHEQTARRFQLYTEVFADRGSLKVTRDVNPIVSGLVKIQTGLSQVSAAAYLKQADEVFAKGNVATEALTHPEAFIRARALALWEQERDAASPAITAMIEGRPALEDLDLLGQASLSRSTRHLLEYFLQPRWFQTPAVLGHAKLFFDDFRPVATRNPSMLRDLSFTDPASREYLCYVLLDFITADPDLAEAPLAAGLQLSRQLELEAVFEKVAAKELKMKVRDLQKLGEQATELLANAEVGGE